MPGIRFLITAILAFSCCLATQVQAQHDRSQSYGLIDSLFPRKPIDTSILGINAFVNDPRFGSIEQQFQEVKSTLRLNYMRVLFAWDDNVQPTRSARPNFSFYDDIASKIPDGSQVVVVLTGIPSWMNNPSNWVDGSPRKTFVKLWVRKVAARYFKNKRIKAYQIWNEPNDSGNPHNTTMGIQDSPSAYVEMLQQARTVVRKQKKKKQVINAATTAINQGYPRALDYNNAMLAAGAEQFVDAWAVHYYGSHYENVLRPGGVEDSLNQVQKPIWLTESGAQGINEQREYVERTWPFLKERIPGIARFYLYQFTESTDASETYGLKNLTAGFEVSDLYIYLRDR
ncbi:MAG: cellulase family glycosylhydrolase [Deltaproteobacteria bacterium]|nr:cellulase family glycosylhydrolase [Deltaproteobacteria bacterium]